MDWSRVVFDAIAVVLIAWALGGLWISTFRKEPPLPEATKDALLQLARLVEEEIVAVGTWQSQMSDRVRVLEAAGGDHALDKRFLALADRVNALELAVKALRERMEEQTDEEDPRPSDLAWRALALLQREIDLEKPAQEVTDNRHPATENDPGRGSATAEKP